MVSTNFRPSLLATIPAISLGEARDMVMTARLIIDRLDGRSVSEVDRRTACADALDLAFYIAGQTNHLSARAAEARARSIAGM